MTAAGREQRTRAADAACAAAYDATGCPGAEVALVAVGGYGRAELAPYSDLDLVLVHDAGTEPGEWAGRVWYPLWDGGFDVDHAVRSVEGMLEQARSDPRTALGMLDVRHVAGDTNLTLRLRSAVLTAWRREARSGLGDLRRTVQDRATLLGELAHAAVPDLKESLGGLRDATVLKALVASWLVDVPHAELEGCRQALLDVRDAQHRVAGRATDRVLPEYWSGIADELGVADAAAAQRHVRGLGRRLTHLSRLTWRRVEEVTRPRSPTGPRRPRLERVAPGVAVSHGEVVLERAGGPADPALVVRAAAEAAERGLVLAPTTAARLGRAAPLASPWPAPLRRDFVRLLAAGPGMLAVWETLDETGALQVLLPEWESVRLLPHASAVHRFTVDRHLVETCIEAAGLVRGVSRPDVLVVASLLHDIGKGGPDEHSRAGEPIARRIAARMGFAPREVGLVATLVRRHLLLPETATTRDLRDPATLRSVASRVGDRETLALLAALTRADARATSEKAWSSWRAGLVTELVRRCEQLLDGRPPAVPRPPDLPVPDAVRRDRSACEVEVDRAPGGATVRAWSGDRIGLLADVAAALALERLPVRAARAWTRDRLGVSEWTVESEQPDAAALRRRLTAVADGRVDVRARLAGSQPDRLEPAVVVHRGASADATAIEVRTQDRPDLVHLVLRTLAGLGLSVRSAHVRAVGPQAVGVVYVQDGGGLLAPERADAAAHALEAVLRAR